MILMLKGIVLILILVSSSAIVLASDCFPRGTCEECLDGSNLCDWIPERFSCAPRTGEDDFLADLKRISNHCDQNMSYVVPPAQFRHLCEEGGILSLDSDKPFGATCQCPSGFTGSRCQICDETTKCPANTKCQRNVRDVAPGEMRSMSCDCTSPFCKQVGFGPGEGIVNVGIHFGDTPSTMFAHIDILKRVDRPQNVFKSPFIIRADLTQCTQGKDIPCAGVCGSTKCPEGVPWTVDETCRVWECEGPHDLPPSNYTTCVPKDEPWAAFAGDCSVVQNMMHPPFSFVCVVPKDPKSPLVNGKIKCGFSTMLLSHGSISLDCSVGTCETLQPTVAPTIEPNNTKPTKRSSGFESWFICSGDFGDQQCWQIQYVLILLLPSLYSLAIVLWAMRRQRNIKAAVQASRILRSHLLDSEADLEDNAEHEEFIQQRPPNTRLKPNAPVLSFSNVTFSVASSETAERRIQGMRLRRRSLRTVLHAISGHVRPAEMCAIMGPSGSGKTSLIDILAGRKNTGQLSGMVALDGIAATAEQLRDCVGYVTQDDILPSTSTVRELLLFTSALRGNASLPLLARCERVHDVLEELNLIPCADAVIGGRNDKSISGGEQRRVSIACELLGDHTRVLVLDEPTSGLDSNSTVAVINALAAVVEKERKTVILSIHQPSSVLFRRFDRIILLSATGRTLYCGPHGSIEAFFPPMPSGTNPAEFLIDLCVGESDDMHRQAAERFDASSIRAEQTAELRALLGDRNNVDQLIRPHINKPSLKKQIAELSARAVRQAWRHPVLAMTNVIATLLVGLSCGVLYRGVTNDLQGAINRAGLFFFFLCFLMLASIADLGVFQEERYVLMRERASNSYSSLAWFISKVFVEIMLLRLVPLCVTSFLLTSMVGLNQHPHALFFLFLLLLLISVTATLQFLSLGMIFTQSGVANFAAILLTMFSLLMSGFLLQFEGTGGGKPAETSGFESLQSLSMLHFGFEALMVNELHGLNFQVVVKAPDGSEVTRVSASGDLILAQLGFLYERFASDVGRVITYFGFFSLFSLVLLEFIVRERR